MEKFTGQKLKNDLSDTETKLSNIKFKINKKFDLIIEKYYRYISDEYLLYLEKNSIYDLEINTKLDIIMTTEDNFNKKTSVQTELFD